MKLLQFLADMIFPPICSSCGCRVSHGEALCSSCYNKYKNETETVCPICCNTAESCRCGAVFGDHSVCLAFYTGYRADSDRVSEKLVYRLKRKYDKRLVEFFARDLAFHILLYINEHKLDSNNFILTYPPRSYKSLVKYGFDHAEKLTLQISRYTGIKSIRTMRHVGEIEQKSLDSADRSVNVSASILPRKNVKLSGEHVLLVDDIVTTGATMKRACELLMKMGAQDVTAVSVFKTIPHTHR